MCRRFLACSSLLLFSGIALAQQAALPGCEPPQALQKVLREQLSGPAFERLDHAATRERQQAVLQSLMKKYPREVEPARRWIDVARDERTLHPERLATLQQEFSARAAAHSSDPLALYLAAYALQGTDTPQAIRQLEKAQELAPGFPWLTLELASIESSGKFADKDKFNANLTLFWTACPASRDQSARWMLVKNQPLQAKVAAAERLWLAKQKDAYALKNYEFLWGLEFRTRPPQEFSAERIGPSPHRDADSRARVA